jgi:phenylacetate-CoA ligase
MGNAEFSQSQRWCPALGERMPSPADLLEFLSRHSEFEFHLCEFIETASYLPAAWLKFGSFCEKFNRPVNEVETRLRIIEAARLVPAYRNLACASSSIWQDIPVLEKSLLRENLQEYINPRFDKQRLWLRPTSGTTGPAFTTYYSSEFFVQMQLVDICKIAWLAGIYDSDFRSRPILCLSLHDKKYLPNRVWGPPDGSTGLTVRPIFDESDPGSVSKIIALLEECQPSILTLKPNILQHLLERSTSELRSSIKRVRAIVCSGAELTEELRLASNRELGIPTINAYGLSEIGFVGSECHLCCGFHVYPDVIVEVLRDGQVSSSGVGDLLLSSGSNAAMPLLRYRTGDIGEVALENCECGRTGKRIVKLSGRRVPNFRLRDGTEFAPTALDALLTVFPLQEFQVTQREVDLVEIGLQFPQSCDSDALSQQVKIFVKSEMRDLVRVLTVPITRGSDSKFQRYISLV